MLIGQFEASAPQYVRSPQAEGIDLPDDHVWDGSDQYNIMTNGVIDTTDPIEVGEVEETKKGRVFPLRFRRENWAGQVDRVEVWYGADLRSIGSVLIFPDSQVRIHIAEV